MSLYIYYDFLYYPYLILLGQRVSTLYVSNFVSKYPNLEKFLDNDLLSNENSKLLLTQLKSHR